jgi:hypothetical protein
LPPLIGASGFAGSSPAGLTAELGLPDRERSDGFISPAAGKVNRNLINVIKSEKSGVRSEE